MSCHEGSPPGLPAEGRAERAGSETLRGPLGWALLSHTSPAGLSSSTALPSEAPSPRCEMRKAGAPGLRGHAALLVPTHIRVYGVSWEPGQEALAVSWAPHPCRALCPGKRLHSLPGLFFWLAWAGVLDLQVRR